MSSNISMNLVGKLEEYMIVNWYHFSILIPYIMGASTKKTDEIKFSIYITKCLIKSRTNQEHVIGLHSSAFKRFFPSWIRDQINIIKQYIYLSVYLFIFINFLGVILRCKRWYLKPKSSIFKNDIEHQYYNI